MKTREFDLVLWGASGFTGRLVAEHLARRVREGLDLRWAVAGRSPGKLAATLDAMQIPNQPVLIAHSDDPHALSDLARRTRAVCSTVGPYALYGSELVAACADHGTHYCDLSGEVQWMRQMMDAHQERAVETGACLVHACGFDSVPSDLGCYFLQQQAVARFGRPCSSVKLFVRRLKGGLSGGTVASVLNTLAIAQTDPRQRKLLGHPYALNPPGQRKGPDGREVFTPQKDPDAECWTAPFLMASVNTRIVRRSHALLGWPWGRRFRYTEAVIAGTGLPGFARATTITTALACFVAASALRPGRALLNRLLPRPGEGPDEAAREAGCFDLHLVGRHPTAPQRRLVAQVTSRRDPGYGATARMLGEAAICLALESPDRPQAGGCWTPATAFGELLIDRLARHADINFVIRE